MTDDLRIRLLGGFAASAGPRTVPLGAWRLRKARSLVKLLALAPGHALHRDQLADILWPDLGGDAARNNLHQAVFAARRALSSIGVDGSAVLGNRDDLLVLGSGLPVVVDVEELQGAVREAQAAGRRDLVARVLVESPGELLPEDAYEPWAQGPATAFREWRTQAVLDVAQAQLGDGEADQAVVLLAPVISADPLHEPAARTMMRALAASGRRSEALIGYERLRDTLREELGAEPESATRDLFRELLAAESTGPDPGPLPRTRAQGNLPAAMTSLIGRSRELEETRAILARTRLLTLTGMGGAGKTALALELARRCTADFPSGAHLVELGALTHREQVAPHIARTLQVELPANSPPVTSLIGQLRHWQVLLVLDNCEHLLDECAQVTTALLRGCPDLHVLATSREALRIEGEVSWRTPSLDLPDPQGSASPQELARIASVELFVRRAAAAVPGFALNGDNASAVAEICYRLDGIPLALELAAACIPVLSPQQIAARLGDALNLLRRGDRATITRQQTLEAALAWSHDLLGDEERVLFRRLSVFAGSFTLPAVEAVCSGDLRPPEVLGALARLVDASLVVADVAGAVTRYRLLETVRQYAALRQRAAAEPLDLPSLHCDWYLQLALARDLEGARTRAAPLTSLDVEHDNLRAAMSWSLQHRSDRALELAVALWRYWLARGFFVEGRRWLEAALAAAPAPTSLRARALVALAVFDVRRGIGTRIAALGDEAVRIHRSLGDAAGLAQALQADAVIAFMAGDWDGCWQRSVESRDTARAGSAPQLEVAARHLQGIVLMGRNQLVEARRAFEEVREGLLLLPDGTPPFLPPMLLGFAVETVRGPRLYFEETILLGRLVGVEQARAYVLCNLADLARLGGDLDGAVTLLQEATDRFIAADDLDGEALAFSRRGCLHRVRGEFDEGRAALAHSLRLRRVIGDRRAITLTLSNLGVLMATEGDVAAGVRLVEQSLEAAGEIRDGAASVGLAVTLASVHADAGAYQEAERHLRAALPASPGIPGNSRATAWAHALFGDVLDRLGRPADAAQEQAEARRLLTALGAPAGSLPSPRRSRALQSRR